MNQLRTTLLTLLLSVSVLTGSSFSSNNSTNQGGEVLLITPLAPDWSNNLLKASQTFAEVLKQESYKGSVVVIATVFQKSIEATYN